MSIEVTSYSEIDAELADFSRFERLPRDYSPLYSSLGLLGVSGDNKMLTVYRRTRTPWRTQVGRSHRTASTLLPSLEPVVSSVFPVVYSTDARRRYIEMFRKKMSDILAHDNLKDCVVPWQDVLCAPLHQVTGMAGTPIVSTSYDETYMSSFMKNVPLLTYLVNQSRTVPVSAIVEATHDVVGYPENLMDPSEIGVIGPLPAVDINDIPPLGPDECRSAYLDYGNVSSL